MALYEKTQILQSFTQVAHQRRNEYNGQFVSFVEMNIMTIKISQNDYYDQSQERYKWLW